MLAWHDEFDVDEIDNTKWTSGLPWPGTDGAHRHHNDKYASYIQDSEARVRAGVLALGMSRRDVTGADGRVFHYTQGMVTTSDKFSQKYGYFEARLKVPAAGPGLWVAFWTLGRNWPPEMDIAEVWSTTNRLHQGYAYRAQEGVKWDDRNSYATLPTGWVTYGMEWGPGYQVYNINGTTTHRVHGPHVTDEPQYLLLNSGVDAEMLPTVGTNFPCFLYVDYVRVYARPDQPDVLNGNFESDDQWPWTTYGRAVTVNYGGGYWGRESGVHCMRLDGPSSGAEQVIYGLKPSTTYTVSADVRVWSGTLQLGAKDFGGAEVFTASAAEAVPSGESSVPVRRLATTFKTGANATTATIYGFAADASSWGFFDDVRIIEGK